MRPATSLAVPRQARGRGDHRSQPVVRLRGAEADVDERDLAALERVDDRALVLTGIQGQEDERHLAELGHVVGGDVDRVSGDVAVHRGVRRLGPLLGTPSASPSSARCSWSPTPMMSSNTATRPSRSLGATRASAQPPGHDVTRSSAVIAFGGDRRSSRTSTRPGSARRRARPS